MGLTSRPYRSQWSSAWRSHSCLSCGVQKHGFCLSAASAMNGRRRSRAMARDLFQSDRVSPQSISAAVDFFFKIPKREQSQSQRNSSLFQSRLSWFQTYYLSNTNVPINAVNAVANQALYDAFTALIVKLLSWNDMAHLRVKGPNFSFIIDSQKRFISLLLVVALPVLYDIINHILQSNLLNFRIKYGVESEGLTFASKTINCFLVNFDESSLSTKFWFGQVRDDSERWLGPLVVSIGGTENRFPYSSKWIFDVEKSNFVIYT